MPPARQVQLPAASLRAGPSEPCCQGCTGCDLQQYRLHPSIVSLRAVGREVLIIKRPCCVKLQSVCQAWGPGHAQAACHRWRGAPVHAGSGSPGMLLLLLQLQLVAGVVVDRHGLQQSMLLSRSTDCLPPALSCSLGVWAATQCGQQPAWCLRQCVAGAAALRGACTPSQVISRELLEQQAGCRPEGQLEWPQACCNIRSENQPRLGLILTFAHAAIQEHLSLR